MANGSRAYGLVVDDAQRVCYALKGNYIDRDTKQNGVGWREGEMYVLDTTDRHGVAYGVDCRNGTLDEEKTHTIQAKPSGGTSLNCTPSVCYRNSGYGDMVEGVGTLRANGGDAGGVRRASSLSIYDARGNGDGNTAPTMTGNHENRITDYTTVLVEKHE